MLSVAMRSALVAGLWLASGLCIVGAAPQDAGPAAAARERVIEGVPQYKLFICSHAAAGGCVLGFLKMRDEATLPAVVIATLSGHMRGCCGVHPIRWDVARGIRNWCERHDKLRLLLT
jgi:hypothetical protein